MEKTDKESRAVAMEEESRHSLEEASSHEHSRERRNSANKDREINHPIPPQTSVPQPNEDQEKILENLALLQSAFVRLQQQQFLQFQMMQYLQAEIIKKQEEQETEEKSGKDSDTDRENGAESDNEMQVENYVKEQPINPYEELSINRKTDDASKSNKDIIRLRSSAELQEKTPPTAKHNPNIDIITHQDNPSSMNTSSSLAMLERQTEEALNSASRGILTNNLLDDLEFTKDRTNADGQPSSVLKHRCRYCGKISGSSSLLQIHIRSHTGERPYKCNICGSGFTTKGNLKVHFERHSEKYPYIPMNPNPSPSHMQKYFNPFMPTMPSEMFHPNPAAYPKLDPRHLFPSELMQKFFLSNQAFPPRDEEEAQKELRRNEVKEEVMETKDKVERRLSKDSCFSDEDKIKEEPIDCSEIEEKPKSVCVSPVTIASPEKLEEFEVPQGHPKPSTEQKQHPDGGKNNSFLKNLVKVPSASSPSSSSSTSDSLYNDTVLDPALHAAHYPRPDSNDSLWENFIEISSDTYKLQELVNNCDNTTTEPNQCMICKKVLSCRSALQMHYRVHTGDRPYRCKICGHSFTTKGNLKTHMTVHRINPPMRTLHQCPVCYQKFSNIFVLQQHIGLHTGGMGMHSSSLSQTKEMDAILAKEATMTREMDSRVESPLDVRKSFNSTPTGSAKNHPEDFRPNRPNLRSSSVTSHSSSDLKRLRSPSPTDPNQSAQIFASRFAKAPAPAEQMTPSMYGHFFPHNMQQFAPAFQSQQHLLLRNNALGPNMPPFGFFGGQENNTTTCKICFKTLASNSALEIHYRSHTKDKPFKCSTCDRGFSTKGNMKQHELVHKIRNTTENSCNSADDLHTPYQIGQRDQHRINVHSV